MTIPPKLLGLFGKGVLNPARKLSDTSYFLKDFLSALPLQKSQKDLES
jgi:hypothetical protein